ncbi:MAG: response regulator [Pseudobutyrivibrio sp.]|nr:response regulator [Pseudobutyrivibrio sp.]
MKYLVLVVDDEPASVKMIEKIIETRCEDFQVCKSVYNGRDALDYAINKDVDVIISDVSMPKMNGLSLITGVKEIKPEIETIIVSGYQDFEYVRGAIRAESSDYILKPITPTKLTDAMSRVKDKLDKVYEQNNNEYYLMAKERSHKYETLKKECVDKYDKEKLYEDITLYIINHIREELSVDVICKNMGISEATLNRLLKRYSGDTYKVFLRNIRIKEALNILRNVPGIPIKDLAYEVGFKDQFYFSKVFKSVTGVNPSEYRY